MTYRGTISKGVVVFEGVDRPTDGTRVEVRPLEAEVETGGGAGDETLERLAREQGTLPVVRFEDLLGGWATGHENDGFEDAVQRGRAEPPRRVELE